MKITFPRSWKAVAFASSLVLVAAFSFCAATPACLSWDGIGRLSGPSPMGPATNTERRTKLATMPATKAEKKAGPASRRSQRRMEEVGEADFQRRVLKSDLPVLVDFYADWCVPCKKLAPVLNQVARETAGARVMKVNVDRNPRLAAHYGIRSIPSLMVFDGGKVTAQFVGVPKKEQLHQKMAKTASGRPVQVSRRTQRPGA